MAVATGLITSVVFNGNTISVDILTLGIASPNGVIDVSTLDLVGFQRIIGRRDAKLTGTSRVSAVATGAHLTLRGATNGSISASCVITFVSGQVYTFHGLATQYDVTDSQGLDLVAQFTIEMDTGVAGVWS